MGRSDMVHQDFRDDPLETELADGGEAPTRLPHPALTTHTLNLNWNFNKLPMLFVFSICGWLRALAPAFLAGETSTST